MHRPVPIGDELEVTQVSNSNCSQQWPKQDESGEKQRSMKICFEIKGRQESQVLMSGEISSQPKEGRREQGTEQKDGRKEGEESGGVFQAC
jgi:hypothetical protein